MYAAEDTERTDATIVALRGTAEDSESPAAERTGLEDFVRGRLTGEYALDEFGFDRELTESMLLPLAELLFDRWFRVQVHGAEHLPSSGGALLVSNHSGTLPLDAVMATVAVHRHRARFVRMLAANLVFGMPFVGMLARKAGYTLACHADAERLLRGGEFVGVFPEGFKGIGKPFSSRYKLQRFGRGGFVAAAMRTGAPVIPCSIVGAEETYPKIGDLRPLARLLGVPYFPVTPLFPLLGPLGLVPLPTRWHISFGEPIDFDADADDAEDPSVVMSATDRVREVIQQDIYDKLSVRRGVFR